MTKLTIERIIGVFIGIITSIVGAIIYDSFQQNLNLQTFLGYLVAILILITQIIFIKSLYDTKKEVRDYDNNINETLSKISSRLPLVSWTSDLKEHDSNVFVKMSELLKDYSTTGLDVLSFFRQETSPNEQNVEAVENYYTAIEDAMKGRGFRYRRAVVVRDKLGLNSNVDEKEQIKSILTTNRLEFVKHWRDIHTLNKSKAEVKAFFDDGRIIDVAFGLFYKGAIQQNEIKAIVIEISVFSTEKQDFIIGLLTIESPEQQLVKAFKRAFEGLFDGNLPITGYSFNEIFDQKNA